MTRLVKLTLFLLAIFPVVFLYDQNKNEISPQVLWLPMFSVLLLAFIVFFIVRFFERNLTKSILIASLTIIILLYYGFGYDLIYGFEFAGVVFGRHKYLFPLWALIYIGGFYLLKTTKRTLENLLQAISFSALIMVLIPFSGSVYYNLTKSNIGKELLGGASLKYNLDDSQKISLTGFLPDIYYIVPDAYAGPEILKKYFDFDNKEFYDHLVKKGFIIFKNSKSGYQNTYLSLASTINMEYINYLGDILGKDSNDYKPLIRMINDNRTLKQLKSAGYKYVHFDSDATTFLEGGLTALETPLDNFARLLMKSTILRFFGGRYGFKESAINSQIRNNILATFKNLENSVIEGGPKFVFVHITAPHGPYVFDRNGGEVEGLVNNNFEDMDYYFNQLIFVNSKLMVVVDKILSESKTPPIIIIQSDHGFYVPPEVFVSPDYDITKFNIRMANFSAYYLPKRCKSDLPQSMNAVNTFRLIFDQCFGTTYGLLENKSYYYTSEKRPYNLLEVDYSKDPF